MNLVIVNCRLMKVCATCGRAADVLRTRIRDPNTVLDYEPQYVLVWERNACRAIETVINFPESRLTDADIQCPACDEVPT